MFGISKLNGIAKYVVVTPSGKTVNIVGAGSITNYGEIGSSYYNQDGSAWLEIAQDSAFAFGTSTDFTMEGWFWHGGFINDRYFWDGRGDANSVAVLFDGSFLKAYIAGAYRISGASNALEPNTWNHIAYTRSGTTGTLWANGVSVGTWTDTTNYTHSNSIKVLSRFVFGQGSPNSYCDEFRISNTARYTGTFTPNTTGFSSDANTLLLLHLDSGTTVRTPKTITANGDVRIIGTQSVHGFLSAYFDGTTDYLSVTPTTDFATGTADFTTEFRVRFSNTTTAILFDTRPASTQGNYQTIYWTGSTIRFYASGADRITSSSLSTATWYHVALVRSGDDFKLYINGTQSGSTFTSSASFSAGQVIIGADSYAIGTSGLTGYIDEFRFSNSARYTTTFTPTGPFTNDSNTLLLMHMGGLGNIFYDDAGYNALTDSTGSSYTSPRTANAITAEGPTVSTTQSKFGGYSASFSGTNYLIVNAPSSSYWQLAGDFTVDFWVYQTSASNATYFDSRNGANSLGINIVSISQRFSLYTNGGTQIQDAATFALNTWHHVALVRSGSTWTLYKNGTSVGTYTNSGTLAGQQTAAIGTSNSPNFGSNGAACFIDELRVSNTARYTTTFTPSTTRFVNDSNTLLLLHMDGLFEDDNGAETPPYPSIVSVRTTATSTATTITVPSTVKQGDLLVLADTSTTVTDTTPSGWTQASGTTTTGIRTNISYKIATDADVGASVTGMAGTTRKVMVVYQGNHPFTSVRLSPTINAQSTTAAPSNQTVTMSGIRAPIIALAVYGKTAATTPTRGWSGGTPTEYSSVSTSGVYVNTLMYNVGSTPANATISMTDAGTNTLQSLYFRPF